MRRAPGEAGGDNPCNTPAVGTRSVFQNLLDNVRKLSEDKFFGSILISMDKVPAMEDEIRRLKEEEKLNNKSQRQLLETFNQDWDNLRAKHEQLVQEKTGLEEEIMHKVESAEAHEAIRKQQADQIQSLRKSEETTKDVVNMPQLYAEGCLM
jgi:chromosome segregation ATPase